LIHIMICNNNNSCCSSPNLSCSLSLLYICRVYHVEFTHTHTRMKNMSVCTNKRQCTHTQVYK
jgi:hypothetical protein